MDNNTMIAVATLEPKFPIVTAIIASITMLHYQVRAEVLSALGKNEPIHLDVYSTGPIEPGAWCVVGTPVNYYRRLALTITCKDETVRQMLKVALINEPVYLDPQDMTDDGGDVLRCTVVGARENHAQLYAERFATVD